MTSENSGQAWLIALQSDSRKAYAICIPCGGFPTFLDNWWILFFFPFSSPFFFMQERKKTCTLFDRLGQPPLWSEGCIMNQCFSVSSLHLPAGLLDTLGGSETSQWRQWGREIGAAETAAMHQVYWGFILFSQGDIRDRYYQSSPSGSAPIRGIFSRKAVKAAIRTLVWLFPWEYFLHNN